jgi:phytoene dehydrogenase-like protein
VVVIGSGMGGLSTACITSALGLKTLVLESHYAPGGVCHGFEVKNKSGTFHFDTGASFFCGLVGEQSLNPVKHALDAVGEKVDVAFYDRFCIDDLAMGGTVVVCQDEEETLRSVEALSPGGAKQLRRVRLWWTCPYLSLATRMHFYSVTSRLTSEHSPSSSCSL